ncbi:hypothetical protein GGR57DRAFT_452631 [Xylariaceae sp. FL1272]|nr:hypothetical protein GGR57DRAFT_452631 [Xylariaceae sp. FL1272]
MSTVGELVVKWVRDNPNRLIDVTLGMVPKNTSSLSSGRNNNHPMPPASHQMSSRKDLHRNQARLELPSRWPQLPPTRNPQPLSEHPTLFNAQSRHTSQTVTTQRPAMTGISPSLMMDDWDTYSPNHTQQLNYPIPTPAVGLQQPPGLLENTAYGNNTMMQQPLAHNGEFNSLTAGGYGQSYPGMRSPAVLMLLAPVGNANNPLIFRVDAATYPRSQIFRDSLFNVHNNYMNDIFPLPSDCGRTLTVNGYDSDGGDLIELTFQTSHRGAIVYNFFKLPVTIVERRPEQQTDVDVILGQDYCIQLTSEYERLGAMGRPSLSLPHNPQCNVSNITQQGVYHSPSGTSAPQNSAISSLDFTSAFFMQGPGNASYGSNTDPTSYLNETFASGSGLQEHSSHGKENVAPTTDVDMPSSQPGDFPFSSNS